MDRINLLYCKDRNSFDCDPARLEPIKFFRLKKHYFMHNNSLITSKSVIRSDELG